MLKERDAVLDALKGIAMLMIVAIHTGIGNLPGIVGVIGSSGGAGVQIFFVISSFLTFSSMQKKIDLNDGEYLKKSYKFIATRIVRLLPLYYVCMAAYLLLGFIFGKEVSAMNVLLHALCLHGLHPWYINTFILAGWYLGTLVLFFVALPLIRKIACSAARTLWLIIGWSIVWEQLSRTNIIVNIFPNDDYWTTWLQNQSIFEQLPVFLVGILMVYLWNVPKLICERVERKKVIHMFMPMIAGCCIVLWSLINYKINVLGISYYTVYAMLIMIITLLLKCYSDFFANLHGLCWIGRNTYPIYLFHFIFANFYDFFMMNMQIAGNLKYVIKFVMVFSISCIWAGIIGEVKKRIYVKR